MDPTCCTMVAKGDHVSSWSRSKPLTQQSWAVVKANTYLLAFPVTGLLLALIPLVVFGGIAAAAFLAHLAVVGVIAIVVALFAMNICVMLAAAGAVSAIDAELHGTDASLRYGYGKAFGSFGKVAKWSAIATVVGLILGLVRGDGTGNAGAVIIRSVLAAAGGVMWGLITFFALPIIMLEGRGPLAAIKESAHLFRQRWGMQLTGGIRIGGLIGLALILPGMALIVLGCFIVGNELVLGVLALVIGVVVLLVGSLLLNTVKAVFSVVLYRYAKDGVSLAGFNADDLAAAVKVRG